jgi:hypothetical protein
MDECPNHYQSNPTPYNPFKSDRRFPLNAQEKAFSETLAGKSVQCLVNALKEKDEKINLIENKGAGNQQSGE